MKYFKLLKIFQEKYGKHIEILAGAGIDSKNVVRLLDKTSVNQIHGTFKEYEKELPPTICAKQNFITEVFDDKNIMSR